MKHTFILLILITYSLLACKSAVKNDFSKLATNTESSVSPEAIPSNGLVSSDASQNDMKINIPTSVQTDKKIIKTANLTMEVKNKNDYSNDVSNAIRKYEAYISKEENNVYDDRDETNITIKVPVLQFDNLLKDLHSKDTKQLQKSISSEDVTTDFVDTKARLNTRKATRDKYMELLQKASKMEDIIQLQREINNIQEEIEAAEARMIQILGESQFSTIHLTYFEPGKGSSYQNDGTNFLSKLIKALKNGFSISANFLIAILSVWPIWLVILLILFGIKKLRKKSYLKKE